MRDIILDQPKQILHSLEVNQDVRVEGDFDSMVVAGMGGSALPGDLLLATNATTVPLTIHRSYDLPRMVSHQPLVIVSTYSGNTEESLSAYVAAKTAGYGLLANTAGGKLAEWSQRDGVPLSKIDFPGMQPRHTSLASFTGMAIALMNSGLSTLTADDLRTAASTLASVIASLEAPAKQLAETLKGKIPVFTASNTLAFAAKNFKIQTNENAKQPAFWNEFPELNHNEMLGFSELQKTVGADIPLHVVMLRAATDHPRIRARFEVTSELYRQWGLETTIIDIQGQTLFDQLLYAMGFGLWTAYYLAMAYGIDPVPVGGVEDFKKRLIEVAGEPF
jgi:glucose/mannose-6-phosphate isomerase